jgi:hypothetical protein
MKTGSSSPTRRRATTGESRQRRYDPFDNPRRAALEEFGDLLAEGLYARLDRNQNIWDVDTRYWRDFIQRRTEFHQRVAEALGHVEDRDKEEAVRASNSIRAAQDQLARITPELCQKFVRLWYDDREKWRSYVANLPRLDSLRAAFKYLDIDLVACHPASRSGRGT